VPPQAGALMWVPASVWTPTETSAYRCGRRAIEYHPALQHSPAFEVIAMRQRGVMHTLRGTALQLNGATSGV